MAPIRKWMAFYNHQHTQSGLGGKPPELGYVKRTDLKKPDHDVPRIA
jgi:putative transposase